MPTVSGWAIIGDYHRNLVVTYLSCAAQIEARARLFSSLQIGRQSGIFENCLFSGR